MARRTRCPICSSRNVRVEHPCEFAYEHVGLDGLVLRGKGVEVTFCSECGHETTLVSDEQQLLQVLAVGLLTGPPGMKGEELRYLRTVFGISQAALAKELGLSRRETIAEWEAKPRIFAHPHEEIGLRALLLGLCRRYVIESEYCFLEPDQVAAFETFVAGFAGYAARLLHSDRDGRVAMARFGVMRPGRSGRWSLDLAAA
jgi:DNA-binding transcriptional regulator YiaG